MPVSTKDAKQSGTAICGVFFISFKSLLVFIYEVINVFMGKLSGYKLKSQSIGTKNRNLAAKNEEIISKSKITTPRVARVKEISEIPGPTSLPFFGTLFTSSALKSPDLMKGNEDREKMYGSIVKEEYFWNYPLVIVLGSEEIKKVIKLNSIFRPGIDLSDTYRRTKPDRYNTLGLVSSQGNVWRHLHATFASVTKNIRFVRTLLQVHNDICDDAVFELADHTSPTTEVPQVINKLITESAFYGAFGKRFGFIGNNQQLPENMKMFLNLHEEYWTAFHKSMYGFPWWKYFPTKTWKDFVAAEDKMIDMIDQLIHDMQADGSEGGILAAVRKDQISKEDLYVVLLELILGATEPVYHSTLIALYWITKYEHVFNKVVEELREQLPTKDSPVDEDVLHNVPYLKACMMEAFRICPTTSNVARVLEEETQLGEYRLPKYTTVIVQHWHACLQDSNFYRAKEFLPERWLFKDGVPPFRPHDRGVMCNFGIGTRECPGSKIAKQLMTTLFCKLFRKYKVKFTKDVSVSYEWLVVIKDPIVLELEEHDF